MQTYQISDIISLPCREDNVLRLSFEPYRITVWKAKCEWNKHVLLQTDCKKTAKASEIKIKVHEWVTPTEGSGTFSTKKPSDLERHLLGVHSLKFKDYAFHCTHCESIFVDRSRANIHMNGC